MKKIVSTLVCLFSVFFTGCNVDKSIENMSLVELNINYSEMLEEYDRYQQEYEKLFDIVGEKSDEEIIEIINYLNNEVIKSNVMITNESRSYFTGTSISSGSGTIIKEDSEKYYVLTNNHVIYTLDSRRTSYYVYDYLNNEYQATVEFYDPTYDLALLSFNKSSSNLRVAKLALTDPVLKENVITIGQPLGKRNIITFGEVIKYDYVVCDDCEEDESNIDYKCMFYDAITSNGNSGGMIINFKYELVGVVTYGFTTNGEYTHGAGSSVYKVKEFLTDNGFEVGDYNE